MALQTAEQFGRYELVSRLGRGGMAETYRSRLLGAAGVTREVLIKKVLPEYANSPDFTTMFIREARISASLSHSNIAQLYDFGYVNGEYFLAMEYVDGQPLNRLLKRALRSGLSCIPVPLALLIGSEICRGLHYAHTRVDEQGQPLEIVHRDISPDNVLVSYEGQVKIVDFGIAKTRDTQGSATEPGVVKGKFLYFAPEQARGEPVDARADVWATGVVLYKLLCGKLPVEGPEYLVVPRLVNGEFPRPRAINPELPLELDAIVMRALAVKREQRYESCQAFGEALTEALCSLAPRLPSQALSYFVQELFGEELRAESRRVQVPRSFQEQLARWRGGTVPARTGLQHAAQETPTDVRVEPAGHLSPAASSRFGSFLGVGLGSAVLGAALASLFFTTLGHASQQPAAVSSPEPLALKALEAELPRQTSRPVMPAIVAVQPSAPQMAPAVASAVVPSAPPAPFQPSSAEEAAGLSAKANKTLQRKDGRPASRAAEARPALREPPGKRAYAEAMKLFREGQFREALVGARECIEQDGDNANCHLLAGNTLGALGYQDKAVEHYRKLLDIAPDHEAVPKVRALLDSYERHMSRQR